MLLKDLRLGLSNVVANPNKSTVEVVSARPYTDAHQVIIGYRLDILCCRYARNAVKLENTAENKALVEQVNALLRTQSLVEVNLINPVVRAYAMISNGNLLSGISIKADTFTIASDDDVEII